MGLRVQVKEAEPKQVAQKEEAFEVDVVRGFGKEELVKPGCSPFGRSMNHSGK